MKRSAGFFALLALTAVLAACRPSAAPLAPGDAPTVASGSPNGTPTPASTAATELPVIGYPGSVPSARRPAILSQGVAHPAALAVVRQGARILLVSLDGASPDEVIASARDLDHAGSGLGTEHAVYFVEPAVSSPGVSTLSKFDVSTKKVTEVLSRVMDGPRVSPDGRRVAYSREEGEYRNVYVFSLSDGSERMIGTHRIAGCREGRQVIRECVGRPDFKWAADGNALIYQVVIWEPEVEYLVDLRKGDLASHVSTPRTVAWSPTDYRRCADNSDYSVAASQAFILDSRTGSSIPLLPPGGTPASRTQLPSGVWMNSCVWSPRGEPAIYLSVSGGSSNLGPNLVVFFDQNGAHPVAHPVPDGSRLAGWMPDGSGVVLFPLRDSSVIPNPYLLLERSGRLLDLSLKGDSLLLTLLSR